MPDSYYLNDYAASWPTLRADAHTPAAARADGLPRDAPLLCSLNQLPKLDPPLFATWLNALRRSLGARARTRMWLLRFPAEAEAHLRREAAAHAGPVTRRSLIMLDTAPYAAHLRRAAQCDLFADSLLYNAHTSATDALWAGTPLLTLPGATQPSRVASSLLDAVGLGPLVVRSMREYEDALVSATATPRGARATARWRAPARGPSLAGSGVGPTGRQRVVFD